MPHITVEIFVEHKFKYECAFKCIYALNKCFKFRFNYFDISGFLVGVLQNRNAFIKTKQTC